MSKRKNFKPGTKALDSGQYEIINRLGNKTGIERTVVKGEPFPPSLAGGQVYVLVDRTRTRGK